jgi:hypothetical protein
MLIAWRIRGALPATHLTRRHAKLQHLLATFCPGVTRHRHHCAVSKTPDAVVLHRGRALKFRSWLRSWHRMTCRPEMCQNGSLRCPWLVHVHRACLCYEMFDCTHDLLFDACAAARRGLSITCRWVKLAGNTSSPLRTWAGLTNHGWSQLPSLPIKIEAMTYVCEPGSAAAHPARLTNAAQLGH